MCDANDDLDSLVLDYLEINHIKLFTDSKYRFGLNQYWFESGFFQVHYTHNGFGRTETIRHEFDDKELKDLIIFMNNPKSYKDIKKFNI